MSDGINKPLPEELPTVKEIVAMGFEESGEQFGWGFYHLNDKALALVPRLKTVRTLDLFEACEGDEATDRGLSYLANATSLASLRLGPGITDEGLSHLTRLTGLKDLRLDSAGGVTDRGIQYLEGLTSLINLSLQFTSITDKALVAIAGMTSLENLELTGTSITDNGIRTVSENHPKMAALYLNSTTVTPKSIPYLAAMKYLHKLYLPASFSEDSRNLVTRSIPNCNVSYY